MTRRKKLVRLPHLNYSGGDTSKQWYVEYGVRNPKTDKMERFRVYEGLSDSDSEKRVVAAEQIIKEFTEKLRNGWSPFLADEKFVYDDELVYNEIAKVYGTMRLANATIRLYSSEWLKNIAAKVDPEGTLPTYKGKLRLFNSWLDMNGYGDNDATAINNEIVLKFFNYIIDDLKFSGNTVRKYRQILQNLFQSLIDKGKIKENPVRKIRECHRINDQAPRPIMDMDIAEFRELIKKDDPQLWLALSFEYYCFLRPGKEVRLLQIRHIDFTRGTVSIERQRSKTKRPKTATIPFVFLKELRDDWKLHTYPKDYFVFSKAGMPGTEELYKNDLRYRFNKFRTKLNMPIEYKLYSWKHTGNSRADDCSEITIRDMQKQNGHTSVQTTENYIKNKMGTVSRAIQNHFPDINE
jgi:integrase